MPFLENVTRGRGVPRERLAAVAEHYYAAGGVSPINQQCRDLLAAIGKDFAAAGLDLPLYWGNRNWDPYLTATVAEMAAAGVRHAIAFVTSAYGSYSGCRQYLGDIEAALVAAQLDADVTIVDPDGAGAASQQQLVRVSEHSEPLEICAAFLEWVDSTRPNSGQRSALESAIDAVVRAELSA